MGAPTDCVFCTIISGRSPRTLEYEDKSFVVIRDSRPQAPVHLLFIPKKHVQDISKLEDQELTCLFHALRTVIGKSGIVRYRIVVNGPGAQLVKHAHMHLMGSVDKNREL